MMSFKTLEEINSQKFKATRLAKWCINNDGSYSATYKKGRLVYEYCTVDHSALVEGQKSAKSNVKSPSFR